MKKINTKLLVSSFFIITSSLMHAQTDDLMVTMAKQRMKGRIPKSMRKQMGIPEDTSNQTEMTKQFVQNVKNNIRNIRARLKLKTDKRGRIRKRLEQGLEASKRTKFQHVKQNVINVTRQLASLSGRRTQLRNKLVEFIGTKRDTSEMKKRLTLLNKQILERDTEKRQKEAVLDDLYTQLPRELFGGDINRLKELNSEINRLGTKARELEGQIDALLLQ